MPLTPQLAAQFHQEGFLVLRGQLTPERCAAMLEVSRRHLQQAIPPLEFEAELGYPGAPTALDAEGGQTVRRLRAAWDRDDCFRDWAGDPQLLSMLRQLLGEPVCLTLAHHNCVMTKHPNYGSATGWHRDIRYWSFAKPELVSVWLALGPETPANGALRFLPGSHRWNVQPEQMDALHFLKPELAQNQALFQHDVSPTLSQGDIVFFHSELFHAAGRNDSDAVKFSPVFAYHGRSNPPTPGTRSAAAGSVDLG